MVWTLEPARWLAAGLLSLAYAGLCTWFCRQAYRRSQVLADQGARAAQVWTVVYASQTGVGEALARQTVHALERVAARVRCCSLNQLDGEQLAAGGRFLFVVSTAGEGVAPDNGAHFEEVVLSGDWDLRQVDFGLLALGDRDYANFCGFGHRLEAWLLDHGARRCFDSIDVHRCDPQALASWQNRLGELAGADEFNNTLDMDFLPWRLVDRRLLNPGSLGSEVYHLAFQVVGQAQPVWSSGDLAQVVLPDEPDCPRDYSIASLPDEAGLQLLVRLHRHDDGSLGRASGWLTQGLALGGKIALRVRPHLPFRLNANRERPLICIGNGVGLAGLRGHLATRIAAGLADNWLLFGERSRACDFHYQTELENWLAAGRIKRLDTVFSRDGEGLGYVQEMLGANAALFRVWVEQGAAVYVCGSRQGMGEGVDSVIRDILGVAGYQRLLVDGRYCRDVF